MDRKGATAIEFAILLPPITLLVMGMIEVGYNYYAQSIVNGTLRTAARMASTGSYSGDDIDSYVTQSLQSFRDDATISIVKKSYSDFSGVGTPEPVTSGTVDSGTYCYQDINGNDGWDVDSGADGLGGAEDVIHYQTNMSYNSLMPFSITHLYPTGQVVVTANTIVSNEPFAPRIDIPPATKCVVP